MRLLTLILLLFSLTNCSTPIKQSCDAYCLSEGGVCERVDQGKSEFNTESGQVKKKPTVFHCKFFN